MMTILKTDDSDVNVFPELAQKNACFIKINLYLKAWGQQTKYNQLKPDVTTLIQYYWLKQI